MAMFQSKKYQLCLSIIEDERDVDSTKSLRQRCIKRFCDRKEMGEYVMTPAGASTYFANLTAKDRVVKSRDVEKVVEKVLEVSSEMYSAVTVDMNKIAIDVRTFMDKSDCLEYCGEYKHFVKGIQKVGAKVGVLCEFDEDGNEMD